MERDFIERERRRGTVFIALAEEGPLFEGNRFAPRRLFGRVEFCVAFIPRFIGSL